MPNRTEKFVDALVWANEKHWHDRRKGSEVPYFSHLMSVAALVMEAGGTENEVVAALLHDTLEDCADVTHAVLAQRFGVEVADIVRGLSDCEVPDANHKPEWKQRKVQYIEHLRTTPNLSTVLVSNADKLHNARCILSDLEDPAIGEKIWSRFTAPKEETLWYYTALSEIFTARSPSPRLAAELSKVVGVLRAST